jgi:acyl carrier protein
MKSLEEFIALFAEQFDDTDVNEIKAETKFRDLDEWSSIIGLGIIAMVDEEFEVALKAEDMKKAITVQELYEVVKSKIA